MKIASFPVPGRSPRYDGRAVVVSDDLATCRPIKDGVTLQDLLDARVQDGLGSRHLDAAKPFEKASALAPLPRAYQFLDGSAYVNHVALVRQARGAEMPERFWTDPLM